MSLKKLVALAVLFAAAVYVVFIGKILLLIPITVLMLAIVLKGRYRKTYAIGGYLFKLYFRKYPAPLLAPTEYKTIAVGDGRVLAFSQFGAPDGFPVFYFHGSPSSRTEALLISDTTYREHGLRIIAINRPGIGMSSVAENRLLSQWPGDVLAVANELGIQQFSVLGFSGGAIYTAACAALIPDRLVAAVTVSGAWQMNSPEAQQGIWERVRLFWKTVESKPFLLSRILQSMRSTGEKVKDDEVELLLKPLAEADQQIVKSDDRLNILRQATNEAVYNLQGTAADVKMYVQSWDINLHSITFPITLFHGADDKNVPVQLAKSVAAQLPNATLRIFENEAHVSTFCNHFNEIAAILKGEVYEPPLAVDTIVNEEDKAL